MINQPPAELAELIKDDPKGWAENYLTLRKAYELVVQERDNWREAAQLINKPKLH